MATVENPFRENLNVYRRGLSTQSIIAYGWKISALVNIMLSDALPSKIILCNISSRKTDHISLSYLLTSQWDQFPFKISSKSPQNLLKIKIILCNISSRKTDHISLSYLLSVQPYHNGINSLLKSPFRLRGTCSLKDKLMVYVIWPQNRFMRPLLS